jgi:hypothetical protein
MITAAENPNGSGRDDRYGHGIINSVSALSILSGGTIDAPDDGNKVETCSSSEIDFQFELNTDGYGYETSWELRDVNSGSMIDSEASGQYGNNKLYSTQKCLDGNSCYAMTIFDTYGDGICCGEGNEGFSIRINGEVIMSTTEFSNSLEITGIGGPQCGNNGGNQAPVSAPTSPPPPVSNPTNPPTPPPAPPPTPRECCFLVWCWSC